MPGPKDAATATHSLKNLVDRWQEPASLVKHGDAALQSFLPPVIARGTGRHPDLLGPHLHGQPNSGGIKASDRFIENDSPEDANLRDPLRDQPGSLDRRVLMRLDQDCSHAGAGGFL